jgi:carbon storage regulator
MLYLTRKVGESIIINDDIEVTVVDIRGKSIKLGFTFPAEATVLRREIHERIQEENRVAAAGGDALAKSLEQSAAASPTSKPESKPASKPAVKPEPKRKVG